MATKSLHNDLLSSLISDIKSYAGKDPLLPWLRGIKKMKDTLPPNVLKEKLPRFLQKCTHTFLFDRRYRNDLRYLRVWLQLMDYVEEPKSLLRNMEMNHIGIKQSLFYQAYALYYEKMKKFEAAEKMYHLGVQNLAEPVDELQKSYKQFLHRMERHKNKNIQHQERRAGNRRLSARETEEKSGEAYSIEDGAKSMLGGSSQNVKSMEESNHIGFLTNSSDDSLSNYVSMIKEHSVKTGHRDISKWEVDAEGDSCDPKIFHGDDTVVVKFVDTTVVGKSEAEDACHHGLVDPTINMKEAMNAINCMFREPLETTPFGRKSRRSQLQEEHSSNIGFSVYVDEFLDNQTESLCRKEEKGSDSSLMQLGKAQSSLPHQEHFQLLIYDEDNCEHEDRSNETNNLDKSMAQSQAEGLLSSASCLSAFVFPSPKHLPSESSEDRDGESSSSRAKLREDTVVHKFVGSTILDEPVVENICHHGLVDPTINLKEAMDDINNMFGKPIHFVRSKRPTKQDKDPSREQKLRGFSILSDDLEHQQGQSPPKSSGTRDADLFEPTVFTKEARDEINMMFGKPLDF